MTTIVTICRHLLSDASEVFDVQIREDGGDPIVLPTVTQRDAEALAQKLHDAITAHTNEETILVNQGWRVNVAAAVDHDEDEPDFIAAAREQLGLPGEPPP